MQNYPSKVRFYRDLFSNNSWAEVSHYFGVFSLNFLDVFLRNIFYKIKFSEHFRRTFPSNFLPNFIKINYTLQYGNMELKITKQPTNHRAQYVGEGSRGPVRAERGYPTLSLTGFSGTGTIRTFLLTEDPSMKFHPFYQVCKVMNKQGTSHLTTEQKIDSITCIETQFQEKV